MYQKNYKLLIMQPHEQFAKILEICKSFSLNFVDSTGNIHHCGRKPLCSDVEIMALCLFQEFRAINSECRFFEELQSLLPDMALRLGSRRNYNARIHRLTYYIERLRRCLLRSMSSAESDNIKLIDSMPIEVCRYSRAKSCKILKDDMQTAPTFGYCATQQQHYFGYKLHCVCSANGVIIRYDLSPAHHHDINYLNDVKDELSNCILIGDKGYRSNPWRLSLFEYAGIELATPCRQNELIQYTMPEDYQTRRKRVEVVFSQLVDQFAIRKSYAKSQRGLFTKIISKITLFTLLQYINIQEKRSICHLRYTLAA